MKIKKIISIVLIALFFISSINIISFAGSGKVTIHYINATKKVREDAGSNLNKMGYWAEYCPNWDNQQVLSQLTTSQVFVVAAHGGAGGVELYNTTFLVGKGGNGGQFKAVNSLGAGTLKNLKIALYYGCKTGAVSSKYGDLCQETTNKGAKCAVGWKVDVLSTDVVEWNKWFMQKARTANIVDSFNHADYWTQFWKGKASRDRMNARNEKGNINRIYKLKKICRR